MLVPKGFVVAGTIHIRMAFAVIQAHGDIMTQATAAGHGPETGVVVLMSISCADTRAHVKYALKYKGHAELSLPPTDSGRASPLNWRDGSFFTGPGIIDPLTPATFPQRREDLPHFEVWAYCSPFPWES